MAGFRKAEPEQAALKIGLYGLAGSGKTFTTLLCAEGIAKLTKKRIAYVDTERGTDFYSQRVAERPVHPEPFDFDALYTRSITEVIDAIKGVNPEEHACIIIDSITHIWEAALGAYSGMLTKVGGIPLHAWGRIKKPYKELMSFLLSSPIHVFIVGRQGNEFEKDEESGELAKIGIKMKAEGETPYEPHILLHMESVKKKDGTAVVTAYAEKDRTGILAGRTIEYPAFETVIRPLLGVLGLKQATVEDPETVAAYDAEALHERSREREEVGADLLAKMSAAITLCSDAMSLKEIGKQITPDLKRQMTAPQVSELRARYLESERKFKQ